MRPSVTVFTGGLRAGFPRELDRLCQTAAEDPNTLVIVLHHSGNLTVANFGSRRDGQFYGQSIYYDVRQWIGWRDNEDPRYDAFRQTVTALCPLGRRDPFRLTDLTVSGTNVRLWTGPREFQELSRHMPHPYDEWFRLAWGMLDMVAKGVGGRPVVVVMDGIETGLPIPWQRKILPGLIRVVGRLFKRARVVVGTESPWVMMSMEPHWKKTDRWYDRGKERTFYRYGTCDVWATAVFGVSHSRSIEAEHAIKRAEKVLRGPEPDPAVVQKVTRALQRTLSDTDRLWVRWARDT